ncbi:MAG: tetratricopeptide repeat protein [Muribaculaceae bacterium]|nr:tetratricopeptide repeat protein [Muribaculaceae bacterium]
MKTLYSLTLAAGCALALLSAPLSGASAAPQGAPAADKVMTDASALMADGDYDAARRVLENFISTIPKARRAPRACYLLGVCEYESGRYENARAWLDEAADKGYADADLYLGRLAFLDYDFGKAGSLYGRYAARKGTTAPELEDFRRELATANKALSAVERITVIDSLAVPAYDFYKFYRLSPQSGRILSPDKIPFEQGRRFATTAFANERGDFMMWAEPDSVGYTRIVESIRLTDGSWHEPVPAPDFLNGGGDADFPFMMPDGLTLYFASDGEGSMGGLDIFVASRDAATGEYLRPGNVGMPYNSPYDDFMLAIDELNGIGWWATDRNQLADKVTLYVYRLNEARRNLDPEDPDLISLARIDDWRATAPKDAPSEETQELERQRETLAATPEAPEPDDDPDFIFPLPGGKVAHSLSDFRHDSARRLMNTYLLTQQRMEADEAKLAELRQKYRAAKTDAARRALGDAILPYEASIAAHRRSLLTLRSDIIRAENPQKP